MDEVAAKYTVETCRERTLPAGSAASLKVTGSAT